MLIDSSSSSIISIIYIYIERERERTISRPQELQKRKIEELKRKKEAAENLRTG